MEKEKKPDLNTKVGKYFVARQQGKNKSEASLIAGYSSPTHSTRIEQTKTYQVIQKYFKEEFLQQSSVEELATELLKNIRQDIDKGAKNKAIELALNRIEPEKIQEDQDDKVIVVLK